ncbi:hypothetical protein ACFLVW_00485 [Chloroflexota bacterium]
MVKKRIAIVLIGVIVVVLGRGFFFYNGVYNPPPSNIPGYADIVVPSAPSGEFTDNHTTGEGIILIDRAHYNNFDVKELNVLILRLVSRGLTIKFLDEKDNLEEELLGEKEEEEGEREGEPGDNGDEEEKQQQEGEPSGNGDEEEKQQQEGESSDEEVEGEEEEKLPNAFIIVSPRSDFSKEDKETINEFLDDGGKLLLIADPTKYDEVNDISLEFGLIFEPGYLYNMKENEINYRNIFVSEFKEHGLTKKLNKIAFYTAGSVSSADSGMVFVDENTFSSVIETRTGLSPIAMAKESKVLAIHDLTFMTEPYNGTLDNNQLISNIADWLMPSSIDNVGEQELSGALGGK